MADTDDARPGAGAPLPDLPGRDALVVAIRGRVDVAGVAEVVRRMDVTVAPRPPVRSIVCDLAGATSCDTDAVGALARVALAARRRGLQLWVRNPRPELVELVELVGLGHVLPVCPGAEPSGPGAAPTDRGPPAA